MEEISVVGLTQRKESVAPLAPDVSPPRPLSGASQLGLILDYPFAVVLRLRVLQIVCGISALVMGSVALIEERKEVNLGLGVPAGSATVLAAAASIHTTRGWTVSVGEHRGRTSLALVVPCALWTLACSLHAALLVQCTKTITNPAGKSYSMYGIGLSGSAEEEEEEDPARPSSRDITVLAVVQIVLTLTTLACSAFCARIDCTDSL